MSDQTFHLELSLARMAISLCGRNKSDPGVSGTIHQVKRLATHYIAIGAQDKAEKFLRLIQWFEDGAVPSTERIELSHPQAQEAGRS